jgi:hypothetical protein
MRTVSALALLMLIAYPGFAEERTAPAADIAALKKECERLREMLEDVLRQRDAAFARVVELSDQLNRLKTEKEKQEENEVDQLRRLQIEKQKQADKEMDLLLRPADGVVTAVGEKNLIELSVGFDDGIREGFVVEVSREHKDIGRAVVRKVTANRAVAEMDGPKLPPRKGDRVVWPPEKRRDEAIPGEVKVLAATKDSVELNLGENAGLRAGQDLMLYRDDKVVARIGIRKVEWNRCEAVYVPEKQPEIKAGETLHFRPPGDKKN